MRIIAGSRKGARIFAPKGDTRPTGDRVREAAFNLIGPVDDMAVLVLFAGSGAMGLEPLWPGFFEGVDTEVALVIRAEYPLTAPDDGLIFSDDGSYVRIVKSFATQQLSFTSETTISEGVAADSANHVTAGPFRSALWTAFANINAVLTWAIDRVALLQQRLHAVKAFGLDESQMRALTSFPQV